MAITFQARIQKTLNHTISGTLNKYAEARIDEDRKQLLITEKNIRIIYFTRIHNNRKSKGIRV